MSEVVSRLEHQLNGVVRGKADQIRLAMVCLLAEGHLLIEDVPGLGKTTLARAIAGSISGTFSRIQFTPDLMPTDITGVSIFHQTTSTFQFHPGPVFANIVLADEVNRASPRTQSALLEVMAERTVTYDGVTYPLRRPFMVVATQNPIEMDGTYSLPEAQLDRFLMRLSIGYPDPATEAAIVRSEERRPSVQDIAPVLTLDDLSVLVRATVNVFAADPLVEYVVRIVHATRNHPDVHLGCSPRASIGLVRAAKALALLSGRDHVLPSDVVTLSRPVLSHRLVLRSSGQQAVSVVDDIVTNTPVPPGDIRP